MTIRKKHFPIYGYLGISLVLIFWYLNWSLTGLRTQWGFFPLWLGYSLTVDALVFHRKGTSLLKRSFKKYISLFLISAPTWWLFELLNEVTQNWHYDGRQYFSDLQYFLLASLSFSTVMPAVFGTAELAGTFKWIKRIKINKKVEDEKSLSLKLFVGGIVSLLLVLIFPDYFFYLIWLSVYLIIEPINYKLNNRTLISYTSQGNWKPIVSLAVGCLICGFFWEMWNYYSYPQWKYHLQIANFLHVFEMPILGYLGYIPFSLELYAIYNFVSGLFSKNDYLQV